MIGKIGFGVLAVVFGIAAIEQQGIASVVSTAIARVTVAPGPLPQAVVGGGTGPDGTTTLLAAGDIAHCERRPGLVARLPETSALLHLGSSKIPESAPGNETAALAQEWPNIPILALGDTVYSKGRPSEFKDCFDPVWGDLLPRILPAPGNHEYKSPGAYGYYDYFGAQAGPDRRGWYSVTMPGWKILSLNSEVDAAPGSPQAEWLEAQLDAEKDVCILAFYHKPAYSLSKRDNRENATHLFRQLQAGGTTLVLNGHNHFYERTVPLDGSGWADDEDGTVAFTVGTGGRAGDLQPQVETTAASVFGRTGLLRLDLGKDDYAWAFVEAKTKEILDVGSAPCRRRGIAVAHERTRSISGL